MARRTPYTKVEKLGQARPDHVRGMGDVTFKLIQCLNPTCREILTIPEEDVGPDFEIMCPKCGFAHVSGSETTFFDYRLIHRDDHNLIQEGRFVILHDDYVDEALRCKYCILCYTLKALDFFDRHAARRSGRQGECRLCKSIYNGIKNQSRITDQHREAAQRRRLYKRLAGQIGKIDSRTIFDRYDGRCFNCDRALEYTPTGQRDFNIDHTLPARFLWPLATEGGTLLCTSCNNAKHDQWPSDFYDQAKLQALALKTGYTYELLAGGPVVNEEALDEILKDTDSFLQEWIRHPADIKKVRALIRKYADVDIYEAATHVPEYLRDADELDPEL